eukprot:TRINITY_DN1545_c0_g1_i12.p1 TRINITY_DN1545_c0_g1~~TRINITY_DN1545_c0_g1_i12.p1  ORF type:complete len:891 (-),score=37.23 TRINITY_DN1545_c0_g1_i12:1028-3700(-)
MDTRRCKFVNTSEGCRAGDDCPFQHGARRDRQGLVTKPNCRFWNTDRGCKFGDRCFNHHGSTKECRFNTKQDDFETGLAIEPKTASTYFGKKERCTAAHTQRHVPISSEKSREPRPNPQTGLRIWWGEIPVDLSSAIEGDALVFRHSTPGVIPSVRLARNSRAQSGQTKTWFYVNEDTGKYHAYSHSKSKLVRYSREKIKRNPGLEPCGTCKPELDEGIASLYTESNANGPLILSNPLVLIVCEQAVAAKIKPFRTCFPSSLLFHCHSFAQFRSDVAALSCKGHDAVILVYIGHGDTTTGCATFEDGSVSLHMMLETVTAHAQIASICLADMVSKRSVPIAVSSHHQRWRQHLVLSCTAPDDVIWQKTHFGADVVKILDRFQATCALEEAFRGALDRNEFCLLETTMSQNTFLDLRKKFSIDKVIDLRKLKETKNREIGSPLVVIVGDTHARDIGKLVDKELSEFEELFSTFLPVVCDVKTYPQFCLKVRSLSLRPYDAIILVFVGHGDGEMGCAVFSDATVPLHTLLEDIAFEEKKDVPALAFADMCRATSVGPVVPQRRCREQRKHLVMSSTVPNATAFGNGQWARCVAEQFRLHYDGDFAYILKFVQALAHEQSKQTPCLETNIPYCVTLRSDDFQSRSASRSFDCSEHSSASSDSDSKSGASEGIEEFQCCGKQFRSEDAMTQHRRDSRSCNSVSVARESNKVDSLIQVYKCFACGRQCSSLTAILQHQRDSGCGKPAFKQAQSAGPADDDDEGIECSCGRTFSTGDNFSAHCAMTQCSPILAKRDGTLLRRADITRFGAYKEIYDKYKDLEKNRLGITTPKGNLTVPLDKLGVLQKVIDLRLQLADEGQTSPCDHIRLDGGHRFVSRDADAKEQRGMRMRGAHLI